MVDVLAAMSGPLARGSDTPSRVTTAGGGSAANVASWLAARASGRRTSARSATTRSAASPCAGLTTRGVEAWVVPPTRSYDRHLRRAGRARRRALDAARHRRQRGADARRPAAAGCSGPASHLHLSGYTLLNDGPREAGLAALALAQAADMTVSVDPSSAALIEEAGVARFLEWTRGVDLLLANREEALLLAGTDDVSSAASQLGDTYREVVVKLGRDGALWQQGFIAASAPAEPGRGRRHDRRRRRVRRRLPRVLAAAPRAGDRAGRRQPAGRAGRHQGRGAAMTGEERALTAAAASGLEHRVVRHGPVRSLAEAAAARGLEPRQVVKITRHPARRRRLPLRAGARRPGHLLAEAARAARREPAVDARRRDRLDATGYERGTITPFGSTTAWPVVADERLRGTRRSRSAARASGVAIVADGDAASPCSTRRSPTSPSPSSPSPDARRHRILDAAPAVDWHHDTSLSAGPRSGTRRGRRGPS